MIDDYWLKISPYCFSIINQQSSINNLLLPEPSHDESHPHRLAVAGGLLRIPVSLWAGAVRVDWGRRSALCTGRARNAGAPRLDHARAGWAALAGKAASLLLASHGGLLDFRRERLGRATAVGSRRHSAGTRCVLFSAALPAWI